jgi:translation elongation factor EF-G
MAQEQERGITITSAATTWNGIKTTLKVKLYLKHCLYHFNIIDNSGHALTLC